MKKDLIHSLKFSEAGVRGIVGESFSPLLTTNLASAFGQYVGAGRVIVGRDTRLTGEMLENSVIAGLLAVGCQPVILGIVPTPTVQMMVERYNASGGIAITASHNPAEWNALKFIGPRGMFLDPGESEELFDIYTQGDHNYCSEQDLRDLRHDANAFEYHMRRIFKEVDVKAIREQKFKVAVDCCNGVGALYSKRFLEELGCEVITVFDVLDKGFEREPEPIADNLGALSEAVSKNNCAVGFAHDPDGDRMAVIADDGNPLGVQYTVLLAVDHVLSENPAPVAVNIQTTRAVEDIAESYGCQVYYSKVGEINVVDKMIECGAEIGGEGNSGGVIWRRIHPGRDSYVAMALVLEMLALSGEKLTEIRESLPGYCNLSRKYSCSAYRAREAVLHLAEKYKDYKIYRLDGLRIDLPAGWVLIRPSNTEPVLRLNVEAADPDEAAILMDKFSEEIQSLI
ncbi:MAG: phosphoglucosamine mutase [Lentisphaerae bacterium]|nr:phosphoglucosamine mutase [Lentisphaerota bacterium]MCP4099891.1 phosphoglucosamine mutase [Lentisphaerota bacterium]